MIEAKIICDSVSPQGHRLTTFQLRKLLHYNPQTVYPTKRGKKWYAAIRTNNRLIYLGRHTTKKAAAIAYALAAKKYHGEFGRVS